MTDKTIVYSLISEYDVNLFAAGKHLELYDKFGSHVVEVDGVSGVYFAVYAPAALKVQVIGDFNGWSGEKHSLNVRWDQSGIWEGFIPSLVNGDLYKYRIYSNHDFKVRDKADPFSQKYELPPNTASIVWDKNYEWMDNDWMSERAQANNLDSPMSVYEMHLGSWKKKNDFSLSYKKLAKELVEYLLDMNYTHVEFLPVMEHPYFPSWGYLCTGFFAPSIRYGDPEELKYLIDALHKAGIGVFLDWVPAHFPSDEHALADFDGTKLFEHPDHSKGFHPDWNSCIFNYERPQVRSFLLSSAHYWCNHFHADGLRVDAVASMLYLDYSRKEGEWSPNEFGGNEYLAAIDFIKELNTSMYRCFPDIQMIAEESTAFNGVTKPVNLGGLGFGLKWMMGWMNDGLEYFSKDTIHRRYHQGDLSRSLTYAFSENYILPLSHDEVVHGKKSLVYKMPGDEWQQFANLRLLYLYLFTHPGQKLLFMGCDIGQTSEWNVDESLPWHLMAYDPHSGINKMVKALNLLYKNEPCLYEKNYSPDGFEWIDYGDPTILTFKRKSNTGYVLVALNFTPNVRENYRIGISKAAEFITIFNSDDKLFWGSGISNSETISADKISANSKTYSININIPPLGGVILKPQV